MSARRRPRRRWLLILLLVLFVEGLARIVEGMVVESTVRWEAQEAFNNGGMLVRSDDPALSFRNRPGAEVLAGGKLYRHDQRGFRVMPGSALPGAPQVIFLGDSTTYGWGSAAGDTIPALVAAELGHAIRPLNLGVTAYHTGQETALYANERHRLGEAPLVVLILFPNDFTSGIFEWDARQAWLYVDAIPLPRALKPALMRSAIYRVVVALVSQGMRDDKEFDPGNPDNWDLVVGHLERLDEMVRADGRRLLVAHLPTMEALDPYAWEQPVQHVARACKQRGIPFVDLLDGFLEARELRANQYEQSTGKPPSAQHRRDFLSLYWVHPNDHHPDVTGNRVAARTLAPVVARMLGLEDEASR